jgi:5-methylcytosine-specific restriction endonuclease McrA
MDEKSEEGYQIPLKERIVHTEASEPPIKDLVDRINKGKLDVQAEFQREYVWENKPELKSKLIESVLLKVPIPAIYTAELSDGKEIVVDGQQRLRTFVEFCKKDGFRLSRLKILENLNGKAYTDLTSVLQDKIDTYPIRVVKILKESHPDIKFDIFERLNRGSVKLSDQELRNCIYRGSFNNLLKKLRQNEDFLEIQNLAKPDKRMKDAERILRFFAFCDKGIQNYKSPLKGFLNEYMENKRELLDKESQEKTELFKKCVELCKSVFGELLGRRWIQEEEDDLNGYLSIVFNEGIFDAQTIGFIDYSKHDIMSKAQIIKDAFIDLVSTKPFIETVEIGTYDTKNTKKRMEKWLIRLREVIDYPSNDKRLYTFEEKKMLFERKDGNICQICKNQIVDINDAHVDHIERFVDGGKTIIKNAQITHRYCNLSKG